MIDLKKLRGLAGIATPGPPMTALLALLNRLEAAEAALGLFEIEDGMAVALNWLDMNLALAKWRRVRDGQGGGDGA